MIFLTAVTRYRLGPTTAYQLENHVVNELFQYYRTDPRIQVSHTLDFTSPLPKVISSAEQVRWVILNGRRLVPTRNARAGRTSPARSALVKATINGEAWFGEILELFLHSQNTGNPMTFAYVRWMVEYTVDGQLGVPTTSDYWDDYL